MLLGYFIVVSDAGSSNDSTNLALLSRSVSVWALSFHLGEPGAIDIGYWSCYSNRVYCCIYSLFDSGLRGTYPNHLRTIDLWASGQYWILEGVGWALKGIFPHFIEWSRVHTGLRRGDGWACFCVGVAWESMSQIVQDDSMRLSQENPMNQGQHLDE